jgi:hypothetical protein
LLLPVLLLVRLLLVLLRLVFLLLLRRQARHQHPLQRTTPSVVRQTWEQQPWSHQTLQQQRPRVRRRALVLLLGQAVQQVLLPHSC